jgi:acetolactate synthase-1/2/3 large subunit
VVYRPVDFAGVAAVMGVPAVDDVAGLRHALSSRGDGPRLVDARIDPSAYRHVIRTIRG